MPAPRPSLAPRSAPAPALAPPLGGVERYDPGILPPGPPADHGAVQPDEPAELTPEQQRRHDIDDFLAAYERIAPAQERRDGWTPFLRKLFLQVIAEGGGITAACEYTGMSRSSAYSLEARDRVFAAGLAAASHFARNPMADDYFEKGRNGITETITRSDGVTITRHRFDSRLSIAVLNRLDRRCDRAEERGSLHLAAVRNWDEYLRLVGEGDDKAAEALLDRPAEDGVDGEPFRRRGEQAKQRPTCPLPVRANPISSDRDEMLELAEYCWKLGEADYPVEARRSGIADGAWLTNFPPPPGFDGYENRPWTGEDFYYERTCTPEEVELLDAHLAAMIADDRAEWTAYVEARRETFFGTLRTELAAMRAKAPRPSDGHGVRTLKRPALSDGPHST
jgi:hypothetical protein